MIFESVNNVLVVGLIVISLFIILGIGLDIVGMALTGVIPESKDKLFWIGVKNSRDLLDIGESSSSVSESMEGTMLNAEFLRDSRTQIISIGLIE
jgi:hypothetical protein